MAILSIRHRTVYRYRQPVAFGEHRMMLRPRESAGQRVIESRLEISPEPASLDFTEDSFGNHIGIARFAGRAHELCFDSDICVEHAPADAAWTAHARTFPPAYSDAERALLNGAFDPDPADPEGRVGHWARQFLRGDEISAFELLSRLSAGIHLGFTYRRRDAKGIQAPLETLVLGRGTCRDFAVLMIAAARTLGFAARFVSGYLAVPLDEPEDLAPGEGHGSTHAWAQVFLPGAGWMDFDPTSGSAGGRNLVSVAVVLNPDEATPLHGTFLGFPADHIGMEVHVRIAAHPEGT